MDIAILGFGAQGRSAVKYWQRDNNRITVCDQDVSLGLPPDLNAHLGPKHLEGLDRFDLIVRSPIIHPAAIKAANPDAPDILGKVTSNTNEFFKVCPTKNIIGVTGTKGKGTASTLIAKMLEAAGKKVHLGGNIGTPPLDMLPAVKADDWVVLELANFQLIDLKHSPQLAVCLMVAVEHLDWHRDIDEYVGAKQQLFQHQKANDTAIYYAQNDLSKKIAAVSSGHKIPYMQAPGAEVVDGQVVIDGQTICKTSEIKLLGRHNWQNICAAVTAVWQVTQDVKAIKTAATSFGGLEHRLELIRELDGVKYYDDSFGSTPETAIVAVEAFSQPKVVILGGSDKGADYEDLAKTIKKSDVRTAVIIGQTGPQIKDALYAVGFNKTIDGGQNMAEIVATAKKQAEPGDVVLLSPGCASFDMFQNYKDRGEQFKATVQALV